MNFNWIFLNPINALGHSNSLYSIKDYFLLNPEFAIDQRDQETWDSLRRFIQKAHDKNLKVMVDLVINHTAIDMVSKHPHWYVKKWVLVSKSGDLPVKIFEPANVKDLSSEFLDSPESNPPEYDLEKYPSSDYVLKYQIAHPYAIDPANSSNVTIWRDLAKLNYHSAETYPGPPSLPQRP